MEVILSLLMIGLLLGWIFSQAFTSNTTKSGITKIDDKNWIVNNELISYEEDTPILRLRQQIEDDKHYQEYVRQRINHDSKRVFNDWIKTTRAIHENPWIRNCITEEKLEAITEKYDKYVFMCNKLYMGIGILSKEEFLIKEENPAFCVDFKCFFFFMPLSGCYAIHNQKTAKYSGNIEKLIEEQFKAEWY